MSELEEKLDSILSNPQAMEQIMALARSLGGSSSSEQEKPPAQGAPAQPSAPAQESAPPQQPASAQQAPSAAALAGLLGSGGLEGLLGGSGGLNPKLLASAAQLIGEYNSGDDRRVALLNALRPFVRESRYAKLDKAIQIAKLSRMLRMALDLFRTAKEDGHV